MLDRVASHAKRFGRPGLAALAAVVIGLTAVACTHIVGHEADGVPYTAFDESGGATYSSIPASDAAISAYRGDMIGKVETPGDAAATERAMGVVDLDPDVPYRYDGWYAAAYYFPAGTFSGDSPSQRGALELMRWNGIAAQFGGVRIGSNHQAQLVHGSGGGVTGTMGPEFALEEGCWNWLAVRQLTSTGPGARNEVWLNGQRVVNAPNEQNIETPSAVTEVKFGYSTSDAQQDAGLSYYLDDATTSSASTSQAEPQAPVCGQPAPGVERPNILVFMTDDQRAGTEDSRPSAPESPYLMQAVRDRFEAEGESYGEAFATTPQCCPSRASIFTGRYAHNHNVRENSLAENLGLTESDPAQQTTLQSYLKTLVSPGYKTAIFGKYLNGWPLSRKPPFFDDWAIYPNFREDDPSTPEDDTQPHLSQSTMTPNTCENSGPNFEPSEVCMAERSATGTNVRKPMPSGVYETDFVSTRVASFLADAEDTPAEDDTPWLMYVTPTVPHSPFTPKETYNDLPISSFAEDVPEAALEADRGDKPRYVRDSPDPAPTTQAEAEHDAQLRMLKSADDLLQDVFDELDARGETGTTLAIFLSDNGYLWGEHGRTGKHVPYTQSAQIPLKTRWPGHPEQVTAGGSDQRLVANIDVAPTVMGALGVSPPSQSAPMDGRPLFESAARSRLLLEGWVKDPLPNFGNERPLCEEQGYCRPASAAPVPEGEPVPSSEPPTWATTITRGSQGYAYSRYFLFDPSVDPPAEDRTIFSEFYLNSDPFQLDNLFGPDGAPDGGDDLGSTPSETVMGNQLQRDRQCSGHPPRGSWPPPCP